MKDTHAPYGAAARRLCTQTLTRALLLVLLLSAFPAQHAAAARANALAPMSPGNVMVGAEDEYGVAKIRLVSYGTETARTVTYSLYYTDTQESEGPVTVTLDTPLTLSLSVKENDICTITFIISGFPDRQIVRKIVKGDCIADIPTPENDPLRVFLGWSLLPEADRFPDLSLPIETDMTLYARFHYHDFSEYDHDAEGHWRVCRCSDNAVGEKAAHEFCRTESPEYLVSPADCTHAAVYRYSCFCGAVSDMTFESFTAVAKGHTEETKDNKIICSECGAYLRDLPPEEDKGTPSGEEETPPHGNTENNSADNSSHTENETPAPKSLPSIAAVSIIAGLLLAAILTIWIAIRRNG